MTFYLFLDRDTGTVVLKLPKTRFLGGYFALLNPSFVGYYHDVPVLLVKEPAVPIIPPDMGRLRMDPYRPQEVTVATVHKHPFRGTHIRTHIAIHISSHAHIK